MWRADLSIQPLPSISLMTPGCGSMWIGPCLHLWKCLMPNPTFFWIKRRFRLFSSWRPGRCLLGHLSLFSLQLPTSYPPVLKCVLFTSQFWLLNSFYDNLDLSKENSFKSALAFWNFKVTRCNSQDAKYRSVSYRASTHPAICRSLTLSVPV